MTVMLVASSEPEAGATTVAVGLAHRLAYAGHSVRLVRLAGDERATSDAAVFASIEFATAAPEPVEVGGIAPGSGVTIVEAPSGADSAALASALDARLVLVSTMGHGAAAEAAPVVVAEHDDPSPRPALAGPARALHIVNHALRPGPLTLAEDRLLAAPTVGTLIEASRSRVLTRSVEGERALCEHIVIGPIAADSGEAYFGRYPRKAVITRSGRVDIGLAALRTPTACLILSGGEDPSPYLLDRVASERETTLLVAPEGTVETARDIEGCFGRSAFAHEVKVERIGELMAAALDDEALAALLETR